MKFKQVELAESKEEQKAKYSKNESLLKESSLTIDTYHKPIANGNEIVATYEWNKGDTYNVFVGEFKDSMQIGAAIFNKDYPTEDVAKRAYQRWVRKIKSGELGEDLEPYQIKDGTPFDDIIDQFDTRGIDYSSAAYDTQIIWFKDDSEYQKAKNFFDRFRYKYKEGTNKRGTKYFEILESLNEDVNREFVEMPSFKKDWENLGFSDDDLNDLQNLILHNTNAWIPLSAEAYKIRFSPKGYQKGKDTATRTIFIDIVSANKIYLTAAYSKADKSDLTAEEKKVVKQMSNLLRKEEGQKQ